MKLTSEMKKYIRGAITDKATIEIEKHRAIIDGKIKKYRSIISKINKEIEDVKVNANAEVKEIVKRYGLTLTDFRSSYNIISFNELSDGDFNETAIDRKWTNDRSYDVYKSNKELREISDKIERINSKIETECGRIFFNIEVGNDRSAIEELISKIDFTK